MTEPLLKRRTLTLVFEVNEDLDPFMLAMDLEEFARKASASTVTFELDDVDDAEFTDSFLTHLIARDLQGKDEKGIVALKFNPELLQDVEEEKVVGPF